jgi:predicted ribosome quality control (RQC) complex YloA/Tae2 family protein
MPTNTTFRVGRNAAENWKLIQAADRTHHWLHMDGGRPSAHVIIEIDCEPTDAELQKAAELCIAQTKTHCRDFVWAQIKDVKLGSKVGEVALKKRQIFRLRS